MTILKQNNTIFVTRKREGTEKLYDVITCYSDYKYVEQFKNTALTREEIYMKIKLIKGQLKNRSFT